MLQTVIIKLVQYFCDKKNGIMLKKNYRQTHKMDCVLFVNVIFWDLRRRLDHVMNFKIQYARLKIV